VTTAFGDQSWKAAWVAQRWADKCVHCSEDVARQVTSSEQLAQRYATQAAFQGSHYLYS
jgi:hypothetical protein